jgi:hypothetical protein
VLYQLSYLPASRGASTRSPPTLTIIRLYQRICVKSMKKENIESCGCVKLVWAPAPRAHLHSAVAGEAMPPVYSPESLGHTVSHSGYGEHRNRSGLRPDWGSAPDPGVFKAWQNTAFVLCQASGLGGAGKLPPTPCVCPDPAIPWRVALQRSPLPLRRTVEV